MGLIETGYKRSLELIITKMDDNTPPSVITETHNGVMSFEVTGTTYEQLTGTSFQQLTVADFNERLGYIKDYYLTSDPNLYDTILWDQTRILMPIVKPTAYIKFTSTPGSISTTVVLRSSIPVGSNITRVINYYDNSKELLITISLTIFKGGTTSMGTSIHNTSTINNVYVDPLGEILSDNLCNYNYNDTIVLSTGPIPMPID